MMKAALVTLIALLTLSTGASAQARASLNGASPRALLPPGQFDYLMGSAIFEHDLGGLAVAAVLADSFGSQVIAGTATSTGLPVSRNAIQSSYVSTFCGVTPGPGAAPGPCGDLYIARFSLPGRLDYGTYLGGSGADSLTDTAMDSAGNLYVLGISGSTDFPVTLTNPGNQGVTRTGAFVIQIRRDGSIGFARALPITQDATPVALAVSAGSVVVTGTAFAGSLTVTPGALQSQASGQSQADIFLIKLDAATGDVSYATYLGGALAETVNAVALDPAGNAYVAGSTQSNDFPVTAGAWHQVAPATPLQSSIFISVVNPAGTALVASAVFGGESSDTVDRLTLAPNGDILLAGVTSSKLFPTTSGAFRTENLGPPSAFLARFPADLSSPLFSTFLDRDTSIAMLAIDADSTILLVGNTQSRFFPVTPNGLEHCFQPGFLARMKGDGSAFVYASYFKVADGPFVLTHAALAPGESIIVAALAAGYDLSFYLGVQKAAGPNDPPAAFSFMFEGGTGPEFPRFCAVNAASFDPALSSLGELLTVFGTQLGTVAGDTAQPGPDGTFPTELSGVQIRVAGQLAGMMYASYSQANVFLPPLAVPLGPVTIDLLQGGQIIASTTATVSLSAPGLFRADGSPQAMAMNEDGSPNGPDHPARPGSRLSLFGTGFGETSPEQDGHVAASPRPLVTPLEIFVNSTQASVSFAGQAASGSPGLMQVDIIVPSVPSLDRYPVDFLLGNDFQLGLVGVWVSP